MGSLIGRASAAHFVFLSAVLYASMPVMIDLGSAQMNVILPSMLAVLTFVTAVPSLVLGSIRRAACNILRDRRRLAYGLANAATFIGSLYFFAKAVEGVTAPVAIVFLESWPILTALLIGPILANNVHGLNRREMACGLLAMLGIVCISLPESGSQIPTAERIESIVYAILSAVLMGIFTAVKAYCVRDLQNMDRLGPCRSNFVLHLFYLPILVVWGMALYLFGDALGLTWRAPPLRSDLLLVAGVFVVSVLSAITYSAASLRMKKASDNLIWLFVPAFAIILHVLITGHPLEHNQFAGLGVIIGANMLSRPRRERQAMKDAIADAEEAIAGQAEQVAEYAADKTAEQGAGS